MYRFSIALAVAFTFCISHARVQAEPAKEPEAKKGLPFVEFDVKKRQVRVECEALNVNDPLEFFCCMTGSNEHESVLRSPAKPSNINIGLLAIGLTPGQPLTYSESLNKWLPPQGPPLHITIEYMKDGKMVSSPANRWIRNVKTKKSPELFTWVYTGSRVMGDGKFAADVTGYIVSVVNFDLTLIDIPALASSANETLEWERNPDVTPKTGTKVWMVIEAVGGKDVGKPADGKPDDKAPVKPGARTPDGLGAVQLAGENEEHKGLGQVPLRARAITPDGSGAVQAALATEPAKPEPAKPAVDAAPAAATAPADQHLTDVQVDEQKMKALEKLWEQRVAPHGKAMQEAAQAQYEVIQAMRREQQRLIDEADRIQRTIDKLEKQYQDMTAPSAPLTPPAPGAKAP